MTTTSARETLHAVAAAYGVGTDYWDWRGRHVEVSDETVRTVLTALGVDVSDEPAQQRALAEVEVAPWRRILPPTVVARTGWTPWVHVHVPDGVGVHVWVETEDGSSRDVRPVERVVPPCEVDGVLTGEATIELPGDLPPGWHTLHAELDTGTWATSTLIITPHRLELPATLSDHQVWGVMAQLYQVRSERSWGVGDLDDLGEIGSWAASLGADYLLVNPLHAAEPSGHIEPSPYLPSTRRFANPLYLRVEDIPEYAYLSPEVRAQVDGYATRARALNDRDGIDRDGAWANKRAALELVYRAGRSHGRSVTLDRFIAEGGLGLRTYATWCVLTDDLGGTFDSWPARYRDAHSPAVAAFAASQADQVRFHEWLQWCLAEQQAGAQRTCHEAGMSIGVITDLAVGVHPLGADAWGLADTLAAGVTVGAPPDQFNQLGQNWHQPPWHPGKLAEAGYGPFRDMVRAVLRDAGGIRVDHIIGLFRLWWVPDGGTPADGTYVRSDYEALVGILVLEAQRAGAIVIGEDLGVVEPLARDVLRERGVLGTSVAWFEWESEGRPRPPEDYRRLCLATVTTHDLPPTAGYLDLAHVELRRRLGLLTRSVAQEEAAEMEAIDAMRALLVRRGLLVRGAPSREMVLALHRFLAMTPAVMLGVSLSDLVGDRRIINQPGTSDEYPNWRVPLTDDRGELVTVEDLERAPLAGPLVTAVTGRG